jgi:myb proto-oncogene protein
MAFANRQRELASLMAREPSHRFKKEEDQLLEQLVKDHGTSSWGAIAASLPGCTPRQCRERWTNYLERAAEREAPWTAEEDSLIWRKFDELGAKWTQISKMLKGCSASQTKRRWRFIFRSRRKECFLTASKGRTPVYRQSQPDSKTPRKPEASNVPKDPPATAPVPDSDQPWKEDRFAVGGDVDIFSEIPWQTE